MLSQPATKIFLRTTEPKAPKWVSEAIGTSRSSAPGKCTFTALGKGRLRSLAAVREGAERSGYAVEGFAPTSRAANQLRDVGVSADTLQDSLPAVPLVQPILPAAISIY